MLAHLKKTFFTAPFIFGPWKNTKHCNTSCGEKRFKLQIRTCTPISPNLPTNISCESQKTLRTGNDTCEASEIDCSGNIKSWRKLIWKIINSLNATLPLLGEAEQWSSWSACEGNCTQSLQAFRSLQRLTGERSRNRSRNVNSETVIETQTQPCVPDCTSGWWN